MLKENHPTKNLQDFIKSIIETKSKEEEDKIIRNTLEDLRKNINAKNLSSAKQIEYALKSIYSDMLGQNVDFTYVFAVKLIENKNIKVKKIGYLACSLLLEQQSDLKILLVASILRDLESKIDLEVISALNGLNKLITESFASAFVDAVGNLINHKNPLIVKKAIITLQKIETVCPNVIPLYAEKIKKCLGSTEPMVINATLNVIMDESAKNKDIFLPLLKQVINIQKQILDKRMAYYDYQKIPEPFTQIKILRIIANLVQNDKKLSDEVYTTLEKTLSRADNLNTDVSYALVYETVLTITKVFPNKNLLDQASSAISKFLNPSLNNSNMVYLGIIALKYVTEIDAKYIQQHQLFVVDCLQSGDDSIRRITLELLYNNTSTSNIDIIIRKLLKSLSTTNDYHFKKDLTKKIFDLSVRFALDAYWFIDKVNILLNSSADNFDDLMLNNTIRIIEENFRDDASIGGYLIENFFKYFEQPVIPDVSAKLVAWVLGNIGSSMFEEESDEYNALIEGLKTLYLRKYDDEYTKCWILDAFLLLANHLNVESKNKLVAFIESDKKPENEEIRLKIYELKHFGFKKQEIMAEKFEVDPDMSFLFEFINSKKGRFYDKEISAMYTTINVERKKSGALKLKNEEMQQQAFNIGSDDLVLQSGANNKWTSSGIVKPKLKVFPEEKKDKKPSMFDNMDTKRTHKKSYDTPSKETKTPVKHEPAPDLLEEPKVEHKNKKLADTLFGNMEGQDDLFDLNPPTTQTWKKTTSKPEHSQKKQDVLNDFDIFGDEVNIPKTRTSASSTKLAPYAISEQEYENMWEELHLEDEGTCNLKTVKSKNDLKSALKSIGFHLVSEIDEDLILAAKSATSSVLLYIKYVRGSAVEYMVKADSKKSINDALTALKAA